jgi:hypothetical protein
MATSLKLVESKKVPAKGNASKKITAKAPAKATSYVVEPFKGKYALTLETGQRANGEPYSVRVTNNGIKRSLTHAEAIAALILDFPPKGETKASMKTLLKEAGEALIAAAKGE